MSLSFVFPSQQVDIIWCDLHKRQPSFHLSFFHPAVIDDEDDDQLLEEDDMLVLKRKKKDVPVLNWCTCMSVCRGQSEEVLLAVNSQNFEPEPEEEEM